jgi:DNA invertase Pin-like site-specific DNA recombinase
MKTAIGYVRVSTVDQSFGIAAQQNLIQRYAEMHEFELLEIVEEPPISGSVPFQERPQGSRVVSLVKNNKINAIIVAKVDRMFRDTIDCLNTVTMIDKANVELHFLDINIATQTPMGRLFLSLSAAFAEFERNRIRERTREAMAVKKSRGELCGTVPLGKRLDGKSGELVDNEAETEALRIICELYDDPETSLSYQQIADYLNEAGIPARGKKWYKTTVYRIIKRRGN